MAVCSLLLQKGDVREKPFNKCKVYMYNQELLNASDADLEGVENDIRTVEGEIRSLESEISIIERETKAYTCEQPMSFEAASAEFQKVKTLLKISCMFQLFSSMYCHNLNSSFVALLAQW